MNSTSYKCCTQCLGHLPSPNAMKRSVPGRLPRRVPRRRRIRSEIFGCSAWMGDVLAQPHGRKPRGAGDSQHSFDVATGAVLLCVGEQRQRFADLARVALALAASGRRPRRPVSRARNRESLRAWRGGGSRRCARCRAPPPPPRMRRGAPAPRAQPRCAWAECALQRAQDFHLKTANISHRRRFTDTIIRVLQQVGALGMNQPHRLVKPVGAPSKVRLAAAISAILTSVCSRSHQVASLPMSLMSAISARSWSRRRAAANRSPTFHTIFPR